MLHVILFQPEIPPNTGNIIRLCANAGCTLHLIKPLGFELDDKKLRRAGLDYREFAAVNVHDELAHCLAQISGDVFACTTKGSRYYTSVQFKPGDALLFGPETRGLPADVLAQFDANHRIRIPMLPESRSLNLSNSVAVMVYEAWRQLNFQGGQ
ncbi:MAG TPA: tRNA (uridine(34)/cytosine(34)/5-carboxymethylaminomethyluridine(34)-2'-O)-methyltransferase TrmL [Pseudomonadales bacterium]|nr:tRNA (uridine(34)/cytosine(34)/5-carboxymethylaminomethyluridine(34)-2'-O)-methyltransferase TrmL [Pseudomonadales bacterium]